MSKYSASIYNYIFNSLNSIVVIVNGIIMVPLYFKYMSVSTYGAWLATGNIVSMLGLVESGFSSVITQKISLAITNKDHDTFLKLSGANIFTALIIAIVVFTLGLLISPFVADWVNAEGTIKNEITIAYLISLASSSISFIVSFLGVFPQVWQQTKTIGIINTIVNIIGIIALIVYLYCGLGVKSIALGFLTRAILNFILQGLWILSKWRKMNLSKPIFNLYFIKKVLNESFYPLLSKISNLLMGNSQSFIIAFFLGPSLAAIYDITSKVCVFSCTYVNMINGSFFALFSMSFATKNRENINKSIQNVTKLFMILLSTSLLYSFSFTKTFVNFWVGLDKYGGNVLLTFIILANLLSSIKGYLNNLLFTGGLIGKSSKYDIFSMITYLLLLICTIRVLNTYAIPIAAIVSAIVFIPWYFSLLKDDLYIEIDKINKIILKYLFQILPFIALTIFIITFKISMSNLSLAISYLFAFSLIYFGWVIMLNKDIVKQIFTIICHGK